MARSTRLALTGITLFALCLVGDRTLAAQQGAQQAATAAASASPELVGSLSKEMGSTPAQAAGAAGALFGLAKSRLKPEQFSQIAAAVPGMDSLLKAAPSSAGSNSAVGTTGGLGALASTAAGLPGVTNAFSTLGLKPDMVAKAVPVLTSYVTKTGGASVGSLLAGALK